MSYMGFVVVVVVVVIVAAHGSWRFVGTRSSKIDPSMMDVSGGPLEKFVINSFLASHAYAFTILVSPDRCKCAWPAYLRRFRWLCCMMPSFFFRKVRVWPACILRI